MNVRTSAVALALILAPVGGYLLLPTSEEQLAMLTRDGLQSGGALELDQLTTLNRPGSANFLAARARLEATAGDPARAAEIMEAYVAARPDDAEALGWLVEMYETSDNTDELLRALARLVALQPTRERVSRLLGLYRLHGRFDDECDLLARAWGNALLGSSEIKRFGYLLAAKGAVDEAIGVLREADERLPERAHHERMLLFELLVESGRSAEATRRAQAWLSNWRQPWLAVRMARRLARGAPHTDALALARSAVTLHPEVTFYLARSIARDGWSTLAASVLDTWPQPRRDPRPDEVAGFFAAANVIADPMPVWRKFAAVLAQPSWIDIHASFAEAVAARYGLMALAALRSRLSPEALAMRPLFAARLALHEHNPAQARRYLALAEPRSLSRAERRAWLSLLHTLNSEQDVFLILAELRRKNRLPADLLPALMRLAERLGQAPEQLLTMRDIRRTATGHVN